MSLQSLHCHSIPCFLSQCSHTHYKITKLRIKNMQLTESFPPTTQCPFHITPHLPMKVLDRSLLTTIQSSTAVLQCNNFWQTTERENDNPFPSTIRVLASPAVLFPLLSGSKKKKNYYWVTPHPDCFCSLTMELLKGIDQQMQLPNVDKNAKWTIASQQEASKYLQHRNANHLKKENNATTLSN